MGFKVQDLGSSQISGEGQDEAEGVAEEESDSLEQNDEDAILSILDYNDIDEWEII